MGEIGQLLMGQIRDYIHVMDLAEGHVAALNYMKEKKSHF